MVNRIFHLPQNASFATVRLTFVIVVAMFASTSTFHFALGQEASRPKARLTPEERAQAKLQEQQRQMQIAELRRNSFAVLPPESDSPQAKEYQAAFEAYRAAIADLDGVHVRQQLTTDFSTDSQIKFLTQWADAIDQGQKTLAKWVEKGGELFATDPVKYQSMGASLREMLLADVERDRFDHWPSASKALVQNSASFDEELWRAAGLVALAHCDFDFLETCWGKLKSEGKLLNNEGAYLSDIGTMRERWARELEFRKKEAEKNDNPQVEFLTTKGRIVVELYEDSAPNAVNSFIYLVEKKYYDNKNFFRVEKHLCAQTGCEKGDGTGDAGYQFKSETDLPNHRHHFRGSLAVALGADATGRVNSDSSGAQFYMSFMTLPFLDNTYTVFGRVVHGMPSLGLFRVMNLANEEERKEGKKRPDLILSARVIRKRDHSYVPTISSGKLYR